MLVILEKTGIAAVGSTEHLTYWGPSTKPGPLDLQDSCKEDGAGGPCPLIQKGWPRTWKQHPRTKVPWIPTDEEQLEKSQPFSPWAGQETQLFLDENSVWRLIQTVIVPQDQKILWRGVTGYGKVKFAFSLLRILHRLWDPFCSCTFPFHWEGIYC